MFILIFEKRKTLKKYLSQKTPIDRFWSGPACLDFTDRGEGLGQFLARSDVSHSIQSNGHACTSEHQNQPGRPSQTLIIIFISHPPRERAEHSGATQPTVTDRRSGGTDVGPLGGGRHSPEGEHAVVESSCSGALSREPEPHRRVAVLWGPLPRARRGRIW
jgi:hypothetical protein